MPDEIGVRATSMFNDNWLENIPHFVFDILTGRHSKTGDFRSLAKCSNLHSKQSLQNTLSLLPLIGLLVIRHIEVPLKDRGVIKP